MVCEHAVSKLVDHIDARDEKLNRHSLGLVVVGIAALVELARGRGTSDSTLMTLIEHEKLDDLRELVEEMVNGEAGGR